jgi:hypothetical protein
VDGGGSGSIRQRQRVNPLSQRHVWHGCQTTMGKEVTSVGEATNCGEGGHVGRWRWREQSSGGTETRTERLGVMGRG